MQKQELYDIYGMQHVPFWQTLLFKIAFWGVLLFLLLVLTVIFVRRRRMKKKAITAWDQALCDLHALRERELACPAHAREFYLSLTAILKTYVHARYCFPVQGKTDNELVHFLYQENFPHALLQELQEIFSGMELIKFARGQTVAELIERDLQRSVSFVERTIPDDKK
ncbi:hypothetical protein CVU75_03855 [Candidatus Dependentiae bacterium HGW-Dependentiae-1]|nr:MAG: hypothetical protein CVU75_03855 [Candidatus Dependentiae bacterium HGW-Dependentiae-1]